MRTRKLMSATAFLMAVLVMSTGMAIASPPAGVGSGGADNSGAVRGTAEDSNAAFLGEIDYLFNKAGYHFWFTSTATSGPYVDGHSYHNIYKYDVEDPSAWCGPVNIPDREPYNAGGTAGDTAYYKIWDVTTETWACGSD